MPFPQFQGENQAHNTYRSGELVQVLWPGSAVYSPLVYAPQALGLALGQWLGLSLFWEFMLARLAGALVQLGLVFWAIRVMPVGRWMLLAVATLPTVVMQASALSGDALTIGVCMAWTAGCLAVCAGRIPYRRRTLAWLFAGMVAVMLVKPAYFALTLLVFAIPAAKVCRDTQAMPAVDAGRRPVLAPAALRDYALIVVLWMLALAAGGYWYALVVHINPNADGARQLAYVLEQPLRFVLALVQTYWGSNRDIYDSLLGRGMWGAVRLPDFFWGCACQPVPVNPGA